MTKIQHRRDNATNWASVNPVLGQGELAYNTTDGSFRIGDGTNHWSALAEYQYGAIHYMGVWDASGGSYPSDPEQGQYYVISVAGTISGTAYVADDWIVYNGLAWNKVNNQVYQPLDSTLTTLSNLTTAADKMIYFTASDTATTGTITSLGRSLIGETTASAVRDLIESTSSTIATMSILIYDGTPSESDLSTYDEIYTTPALCFAALPVIINHAITIKIREADGSAYAAATLQRVVAGGSITIQGEYYYGTSTVASAGSGAGSFNAHSAHSGLIQAGDKILLLKYSGTVGASTPSDGFIDTVASVDGTEVTLTTRTSDTFDATWQYMVVRTECVSLTVKQTNNVTIRGLYVNTSEPIGIYFDGCMSPRLHTSIIVTSGSTGIRISDCISDMSVIYWDSIAIKNTSTATNRRCLITTDASALFRKSLLESAGSTTATYAGICNLSRGAVNLQYSIIRSYGTGTTYGVVCPNVGGHALTSCLLDGASDTYKMGIALQAIGGAKIACNSLTFGSYITTQKSPANWAATTDGSYIS